MYHVFTRISGDSSLRRYRSLFLCPLPVERYSFPLFVDSTQALYAPFCFKLHPHHCPKNTTVSEPLPTSARFGRRGLQIHRADMARLTLHSSGLPPYRYQARWYPPYRKSTQMVPIISSSGQRLFPYRYPARGYQPPHHHPARGYTRTVIHTEATPRPSSRQRLLPYRHQTEATPVPSTTLRLYPYRQPP